MSEVVGAVLTPLSRLDERYGHLRIVQPQREAVIEASLRRHGQLMPLVVVERDEKMAVVDGFKRLPSARRLWREALEVRVLELSEQAAVAVVYGLNRDGRGMSDFEQALVVRTLCREHRLSQVEVAELLSHHKSWVSRRLSLVEQLDEQVQQDLRVGLISLTVAREVVRLPHGNQAEVAQSISRHALTSREATQLVTLFEKAADRAEQQALLEQPDEALSRLRGGPSLPPHDLRLSAELNRLRGRVVSTAESSSQLSLELSRSRPATWSEVERSVLTPLLAGSRRSSVELADLVEATLDALEVGDGRR